MADIKQIQFKRSNTPNKVPTTAQLAEGEIAINFADKAIYTRIGNSIDQLTGKGIPLLDSSKVVVNQASGSTMGPVVIEDGLITFENKKNTDGAIDSTSRHIQGKNANDDGWYIGSGGTPNAGYLEIGTIDDGNEEIRFVQRSSGNAIKNTLKLINSSGDTEIPGNLKLSQVSSLIGVYNNTNKMFVSAGANDVYIRNAAGGTDNQLEITNDKKLRFNKKDVYWEGNKPTKDDVGLGALDNNRQCRQAMLSPNTGGNVDRYHRIAIIQEAGNGSAQLDLLVGGGIDSGHQNHYSDFVYVNGRGIPATITGANIASVLQQRRVGKTSDTDGVRYGVVKTADGFDLYIHAQPYANTVFLTLLNLFGNVSYGNFTDVGGTAPAGYVECPIWQIRDTDDKVDINSETKGVLTVANGGTGGTSAAAARNNLGLGTAAVRDVGESTGNVLENGAYGLGGNGGKSVNDITSLADMMNRLKGFGGTFWRGAGKAGTTVNNAPYAHGSGIFMNAGDTMSAINIDYASGRVRVYAANNGGLAAGNVNFNELYGTANKPTPADVDAVARSGDTMTGSLTAPSITVNNPGAASVYIQAGRGTNNNAHLWFRNSNDNSERGVVWAEPNTTTLGVVKIRAKTTNAQSSGDFQFRSDGQFMSPSHILAGSAKFGTDGNITGTALFNGNLNTYLTKIITDAVSRSGDSMSGNLKIENSQGSWLDVGSENYSTYSRITLARSTGATTSSVANLKITPEGYVQFGIQNTVAQAQPDKYLLIKQTGTEFEGEVSFNNGYIGNEIAINISDKTINLNDLMIKTTGSTDNAGTRKLYNCRSSGGGANITNKPGGIDGNFTLEVLSLRKVSDTDFTNKQTLTYASGSSRKVFTRYCTNNSWSGWSEIAEGIVPISLGGTGGNSVNSARNNLGIGTGDTVTFGNLVTTDMSVNGNQRIVGRLNLGNAGSTTGTIRTNDVGAMVIGSGAGQPIHFRGGDEASSSGEMRLEANGNLTVNGSLTTNSLSALNLTARNNLQVNNEASFAKSIEVQQNIVNKLDNTMIVMGKDSDLAMVKKNGSGSKIAIGSAKVFAVAKSSAAAITNPGSETYTDIFTVNNSGDAKVFRNLEIVGQATQSDAPTANAHLANKKYVDDRVNGAGNLYLPLTGGTVTGNLDVTGTTNVAGFIVNAGAEIKGALTTRTLITANNDINLVGGRALNFVKGGAIQKNMSISHRGEAGQRAGRIEFSGEGDGQWIAYFEQQNDNRKLLSVNGNVNTSGLFTVNDGWGNNRSGQLHDDGNLRGRAWDDIPGTDGYLNNWIRATATNTSNTITDDKLWAWRNSTDAHSNGMYIMARTMDEVSGGEEYFPGNTIDGYKLTPCSADGWRQNAVTLPGRWLCCGVSVKINDSHRTTIWKRVV